MTDWFFFMVLDIGNPTTEAIPLGTRFLVGLFQAIAVRAAGFSAVSVAQLAAAVKYVSNLKHDYVSFELHMQSSLCGHDVHQCLYVPFSSLLQKRLIVT